MERRNESTVLTWIKLLPLELQDIEPMASPNNEEVAKGEKILGELGSTDVKRLYTLAKAMAKNAALAAIDAKFEASEQQMGQAMELKAKSDTLTKLFWIGVNSEVGSWDKGNIGIRKDWTVVECAEESDMPPSLKHLLDM